MRVFLLLSYLAALPKVCLLVRWFYAKKTCSALNGVTWTIRSLCIYAITISIRIASDSAILKISILKNWPLPLQSPDNAKYDLHLSSMRNFDAKIYWNRVLGEWKSREWTKHKKYSLHMFLSNQIPINFWDDYPRHDCVQFLHNDIILC